MIKPDEISIEKTVQDALEHFKEHGWAESVLLAVSKATGQDCGCIPHIAAGLQGGLMAGEVCGAVSGAVLAIGLLCGEAQAETATQLTEEFMHCFKERHGKVRCIDIVGFNIGSANTKFEISSAKDFFLFVTGGGKRICNQAVATAVRVLMETLKTQET